MNNNEVLFATERRRYHEYLLSSGVLSIDTNGVASNADKSSRLSKEIARNIADRLMAETKAKMVGQSAGADFEEVK